MSIATRAVRKLANSLYSFEHNWPIDAILFGEPFVEREILVYRTGSWVSFCLFPFSNDESWFAAIDEAVGALSRSRSGGIRIYGQDKYVRRVEEAYAEFTVYYEEPHNCREYAMFLGSPEALGHRAAERGAREGLIVEREAVQFLSERHIGLIKAACRKHNMWNIDRVLLSLASLLARVDGIALYNVRLAAELVGFGIFSELGKRRAFYLSAFRNDRAQWIHDSMMQAVYEDQCCLNGRTVLLGPGSTPGIARFKSKWGAIQSSVGPTRGIIWACGSKWPDRGGAQGIWWRDVGCEWLRARHTIGELGSEEGAARGC